MKQRILFILMFVLATDPLFARSESKYMTDFEYQEAIALQNKIHAFVREANTYKKKHQYQQALDSYIKAYQINQCAGLVAVCRGGMADNLEALGKYGKALEHVEWFLNGLKPNEPLYKDMTETKQRLLRKIEAQKRGEKIDGPATKVVASQPIRNISDFQNSSYDNQKSFMEKQLPESTEIQRLSKQAMLAEHAGKFSEAKEYYEQLLVKKDDVIAVQGEIAWVMLHPAVQRTSELTGDKAREREMLLWIRDNMMAERGAYHKHLNGVLPQVQSRLKERINEL